MTSSELTLIALAIDGKVVETIAVPNNLAAALLSNPDIIDAEEYKNYFWLMGGNYDKETGKVTPSEDYAGPLEEWERGK